MGKKGKQMPVKRTMNLYFKADRTTKPATIALYVIFISVVMLGLLKILVYDLWMQVEDARTALSVAQGHLAAAMAELSDYADVKQQYQRYAATDEERAQIGRMEIVDLLDREVGSLAQMREYAVNGMQVQIRIDKVTLAQTAEIVRRLEASPIVGRTTVNTAATTDGGQEAEMVSANILIELQKEGVSADEKAPVGS